jgi:hypothetical protein
VTVAAVLHGDAAAASTLRRKDNTPVTASRAGVNIAAVQFHGVAV